MDIVVLVDNRIDYARSPLHFEYFDWYHYGGIARSAEVHRLGPCWINNLQVITEEISPSRVRVILEYDASQPSGQRDLIITWDGQEVLREPVDLVAVPGRIERMLEFPDATLWSPAQPNLHQIYVQLGDDDMRERIGLRQIRLDGQQILINGEPVHLLGFCRHDAHPQFGHGLPNALFVADVQQLRDIGCNFVRGSHYPQDVRFLDLCDEAGICVWSESIGWQHTAEHFADAHFFQAQLTNIDEMVAQSANRPSVIMWGILNESHSEDPAYRPAYETLLDRLRELDIHGTACQCVYTFGMKRCLTVCVNSTRHGP